MVRRSLGLSVVCAARRRPYCHAHSAVADPRLDRRGQQPRSRFLSDRGGEEKAPVAQLGDIRWGGRVMADEVGAGFFSNGWGLLPWMISAEPLDRYDVYRVE